MADGWISLHRKIEECWLWLDEPFSKGQAWVDLLLMANHHDKQISFNGEIITVSAGSRITSILYLSERWKWSRHKVSNFLNLLEKDKMITQKRDNKKTLITIVNYELYQSQREDRDIKRTSKGHQKDINNNDNKEININNVQNLDFEREFLGLYKGYPKKVGKATAKKKYNTLRKRYSYEQIKSGVKAYYLHKLDENHGEVGDLKFWKGFDVLMNQIENWIPEGEEDGC